ncbi:hypothetical protein ATEIFO6365_0010000400 [Aspergillus terreus]|uniref:Uncharacterized protein n=1 Tax=Aspergillus terreus TaxID=33178 RepID=A0A5M3Z8Z1_ASPTE|nr:hypothetical protein ATETN484_0012000400 [Aspergillus terreus]GFF19231.1 hypothetical protein ATEIFO6365_0010000400 [Aspergillus terreus]
MHPLLNDSPSSPPRDNLSYFLVVSEPGMQVDLQDAARRGQLELLRSVAYNKAWFLEKQYCRSGYSLDSVEPSLRGLWLVYSQCARYFSHESSEQDTLVLDILRTRGRGPLTRRAPGGVGFDVARTPDGTVWNDLPYLATDMTAFWNNECAAMSTSQRVNASSFLAKLASARVANDGLFQIALILFRDTFEDERPLGSSNDPDDECPRRSVHVLTITALLPAACAWIREAGHNLILLSDTCWNQCSDDVIGKGRYRFVQSELGQRSPGGFSPWRWLYWLKRLHEIRDEATQAEEKVLAQQASRAVDTMVGHVQQRNAQILRVFEAAGDTLREDPVFSGLKEKY